MNVGKKLIFEFYLDLSDSIIPENVDKGEM